MGALSLYASNPAFMYIPHHLMSASSTPGSGLPAGRVNKYRQKTRFVDASTLTSGFQGDPVSSSSFVILSVIKDSVSMKN